MDHCAACCYGDLIVEYDHTCPLVEHREMAVRQWGPLTVPTGDRKVCLVCPVRNECDEAGEHEPFGVWGGITARQRKGRRSTLRLAVEPTP